MDQKDEIKEKLDLVELIREYIPLKAVGVNFQALCPFHREKTPSFVVSPERQIWKCFGCGKGGDVFSFVMEMEGLGFAEALRQLAPKAGITLRRQDAREQSQRNRLLDCLEFSVSYYHRTLLESADAQPARTYLAQRGLNEDTVGEFKIGYSRDSWDDLYGALRKRGFNDQEIFLSGLTVKKDNGFSYYNRFRGRIMFPIFDVNGNAIAFTARVTPEREATEKQGKYVNSPLSPLYDKSKVLFGLDKARQAVRQEDAVIVVEGQMDMISSYQAGIKNVVASSGTALSSDQIKLIKRYTNNILFSFDVDVAGISAASKQIEAGTAQKIVREARMTVGEDRSGALRTYIYPALSQDINIKVIQVPGGKDPDECIRNDVNEWKKAVNNAQSVIDYCFNQVFINTDVREVADKKRAAVKILNIISHIENAIEQDTWLRRLAETLMVQEDSLRAILRAAVKTKRLAAQRRTPQSAGLYLQTRPPQSQMETLTESLLALALKFFPYLEYVMRNVTPEMLAGDTRRRFYKLLVMYYSNNAGRHSVFASGHFAAWLQLNIKDEQDLAVMRDTADMLLLLADKDFYDLEAPAAKVQLQRIMTQLKRAHLSARLLLYERELNLAERQGNSEAVASLMTRVTQIISEMKHLNV